MQEASVMTSLHELRAIEQQRIADERAAIEQRRAAHAEAARAAEQARIAAAAARERAQREDRLRGERARADAERELRLRVEATEAAERARLAARLEDERLAQELALRREVVARQRPTWMVAVTAVALAAGVGLAVFAVERTHDAEAAQVATARADAEKAAAKADAAEALAKLDAMQRDLDVLDGKVAHAQAALEAARTELERRHAQQLLDEANRRVAAARQHLRDLQAAHDHQVRLQGIRLDDCAKNNVICPSH